MSKYKEFKPFLYTSILAAHSSSSEQGFRQKDVKYFLEVFTNWIESLLPGPSINIQNTQISRFLEKLTEQEILRKENSSGVPIYHLTRIGLHEIVSSLVSTDIRPVAGGLGTFLFLYHFVHVYSHKLESMLTSEMGKVSPTFQIELKHLLNSKTMLERQKEHVVKEIEKLEWRINEARKASKYASNLISQKVPLAEVVEKVQELYPYELNNQKTMVDLYEGIPDDLKKFELEVAPVKRANSIWVPLCNLYKSYLSELEKLNS